MKKIFIALALCLVMAGLIATPALAATQKVNLVHESNLAPAGYATFITNQGDHELVVRVTLKGALPNAKYGVYLRSHSWTIPLGNLTTNSKGNWGGQNEQYEFQIVMQPGIYRVTLSLVNGPIDSPNDAIISTPVTVKIR